MNCVRHCMATLHDRVYNHHIQRLMVLGNLAMLPGVDPWEMTEWMWSSFIDGAEWGMLPNVIGMSQWADFLARHRELLVNNQRTARHVRASEQQSDLPAVRERAVEVRRRLDDGTL